MIKLKNLLKKKIIKEATTSGQATGAKRQKGTSPTTQKATSDYDAHMATEPKKTTSDLTRWTHPYSKVTTTLSKGQTQPALGWTDTPGKKVKGGSISYGAGSKSDYASSPAKGYSRGPSAATVNPLKTNPDWTTWDTKRQSYDLDKSKEVEKDTKDQKAQPISQIGYGTSGGGMRGKGGSKGGSKGKGKGKGKGKDKKKD